MKFSEMRFGEIRCESCDSARSVLASSVSARSVLASSVLVRCKDAILFYFNISLKRYHKQFKQSYKICARIQQVLEGYEH